MSLTEAIMPSLRDRHLALEAAEVKAPKAKAVKKEKVELGGKKKGKK